MTDQRPYPELLNADEAKALLTHAEQLWSDLQQNELGGFGGINRPFYIVWKMKEVIEQFGHRDVGLSWSKDALDAHPNRPADEQKCECGSTVFFEQGERETRCFNENCCAIVRR